MKLSALLIPGLAGLAAGQTAPPAVPFLGTASFNAFSLSSGIAIGARAANGSYTILRFGLMPPYPLLSSMADFLKLMMGYSLGPQSSAAPKGAGIGSQAAAIGSFAENSTFGVALAGVISAGATNSSIVVFQFGGSFGFGSKTSYPIGAYPAGVLAADFNGDGKVDLAVPFLGDNVQNTPGGVAILISNGTGGFAPKVVYSAGASPIAVSALDLDGDGVLDLAVADCGSGCGAGSSNGGAWVLFGKGDGTFSAAANVYTAPSTFGAQTQSVSIADFDGDSRPDLAVGAADGSVTLLLNKGNGAFDVKPSVKLGSGVAYLAAGDLNGDGRMDLAAAGSDGTVSVLLGNSSGVLQLKSVYAISSNPDSLILTDYNGDGKLDIINGEGDARGFGPSHGSGNIDILQGNGDGTFQGGALNLIAGSTGESAIADFDGDGKPDVAVGVTQNSGGGGVTVFRGNGDGTLRAGIPFTGSGSARSVAAGDFNGDGKADIATNSELFPGNGDGTFRSAIPLPATGSLVRAGDFNRDGKTDLAVVSTGGTLTILLGSGNGFQTGQSYNTGKDPAGVVVADFNHDGNLDLAVTVGKFNGDAASVAILLGKGDGTFQNPISAFAGQGPYLATAAGDFNGDGNADLAVAYETADFSKPPYVGVLLGNGDGTFREAINVPVANDGNPASLVTADFNGDGKTDLVVAGCCGATQMAYLAGNGDGTFQAAILFPGGPSPGNVISGDLNGDKKPDLVIVDKSSTTSGAVLALLNAGGSGPLITPGGIVNGGSFVPNQAVSPGSIVAIFGSNLSSQTVLASNIPLPTTLNNVSVTMNGEMMPLYFVSGTQINAQAPWDLSTSGPATVVVTNNGAAGAPAMVSTSAVSPAVMTDGAGHAIAVNLDGTVAAAAGAIPGLPTHPAARGQAIILYATGLGPVDHDVATGGIPATGVLVYTTSAPTILLSGTPVAGSDILFSGLTPQFVGVNQLNILIPADAPTGNAVPVQISVGGVTSPASVTLAIQ